MNIDLLHLGIAITLSLSLAIAVVATVWLARAIATGLRIHEIRRLAPSSTVTTRLVITATSLTDLDWKYGSEFCENKCCQCGRTFLGDKHRVICCKCGTGAVIRRCTRNL